MTIIGYTTKNLLSETTREPDFGIWWFTWEYNLCRLHLGDQLSLNTSSLSLSKHNIPPFSWEQAWRGSPVFLSSVSPLIPELARQNKQHSLSFGPKDQYINIFYFRDLNINFCEKTNKVTDSQVSWNRFPLFLQFCSFLILTFQPLLLMSFTSCLAPQCWCLSIFSVSWGNSLILISNDSQISSPSSYLSL